MPNSSSQSDSNDHFHFLRVDFQPNQMSIKKTGMINSAFSKHSNFKLTIIELLELGYQCRQIHLKVLKIIL